jgi:Tfp pilus assembly protein PilF
MALVELEKILVADPRSVDARVQLAFLHGRAKRHDEAIRLPFTNNLQQHGCEPEDGVGLEALGIIQGR